MSLAVLGLLLLFMSLGLLTTVVTVALSRRRGRMPLPDTEAAALSRARHQAAELAASGRIGDGLACLVGGMRQAQGARKQGRPWAEELAVQWESAVNDYAASHRIGPSPELVPATAPASRGDEPTPAGEG
jgi:hypothetical protein